MRAVAKKLMVLAKDGEIPAIKELLERTLGKPVEADLFERLESLEQAAARAGEAEERRTVIRNRLMQLEKLAAEVQAGCPCCIRAPGRVRVVLPDDPRPTGEETCRCDRCETVHPVCCVEVIVPGINSGATR